MYEYPYPFNDPLWNLNDQKYWFKMVRTYHFPVTSVRAPHRYLIETNQDATWEASYAQYLSEQ